MSQRLTYVTLAIIAALFILAIAYAFIGHDRQFVTEGGPVLHDYLCNPPSGAICTAPPSP